VGVSLQWNAKLRARRPVKGDLRPPRCGFILDWSAAAKKAIHALAAPDSISVGYLSELGIIFLEAFLYAVDLEFPNSRQIGRSGHCEHGAFESMPPKPGRASGRPARGVVRVIGCAAPLSPRHEVLDRSTSCDRLL
jgi:hypothetical protein